MEGRYSNRDFTSINLEERGSHSSDDDRNRASPVERQASGTLLENEKITFSWSNLTVSLQRNKSRLRGLLAGKANPGRQRPKIILDNGSNFVLYLSVVFRNI